MPEADRNSAEIATKHEDQLTKPQGSLGRLEELNRWLCAWQGRYPPLLERPAACVFAGNHGVAVRGVSAFPWEVTHQMVANFQAGGAAVNQLCRTFGVELKIYPLALSEPTKDFTEMPAMNEEECVEALQTGMDAVSENMDVVCPGEMGIGNTTAAAALALGLLGETAEVWVGRGSGICDRRLQVKTDVVTAAVKRYHKDSEGKLKDALEIMRHLGGRELAAIMGVVLGARLKRVPVLLDGYIATVSAAALEIMRPGALDHCQAAHESAEMAHKKLLKRIGKKPLVDLGMRLGEGSGAVLAVALLKAAVNCHNGMATFTSAGVEEKSL